MIGFPILPSGRSEKPMTRRDDFVKIALTWDGVPWRRVGCTREGVNCLGLIVGVARECGFLEDIAAKEAEAQFPRPMVRGSMLTQAKEDLDPIHIKDAVPGDLLMFRIDGEPQHITIITHTNPLQIIHSDNSTGRKNARVRHSVLPYGWKPILAFRIRELNE